MGRVEDLRWPGRELKMSAFELWCGGLKSNNLFCSKLPNFCLFKPKINNRPFLQITKDGCSETKSCHSEPSDCTSSSDCNYLVTYKPVGDDEVEFEISAKDQWAAIGFNKQKNEMVSDFHRSAICSETT